ncbi:MAG: M20/M25/M40 family metallo-hydrolase [Pseudomonadota bacterium]
MSDLSDRLAAHVDLAGDFALLSDLVAAVESREAVDDVVAAALTDAGLGVERLTYEPASVPMVGEFAAAQVVAAGPEQCVIGRQQAGAQDGPMGRSLVLFAHPDVEPFAPDPRWCTDPLVLSEADGKLFGWGVADDLCGIATMVRAVALLKRAEVCPRGELILVSAPSKRHRRGMAAALAAGVSADGVVYCHPAESGAGLDEIKAFTPGQLEFTVRVEGQPPDTTEPAHTAFAHTAVNAMDEARPVLDTLKALDRERAARLNHPRLESAIGRSTNLMISRCEFGVGGALSRLPSSLLIGGAMSLVPGERIEDAMGELEAAVDGSAAGARLGTNGAATITWVSAVSAAQTSPDDPLHRLTLDVLGNLGARSRVNALHTASDIRHPIVQRGIATVGFGPRCGNLTMNGQANEWVEAADYGRAVIATALLAARWCQT